MSTIVLPSPPSHSVKPTNQSHQPDLPACPFCNRTDEIEVINWSNERADGSEYCGEAVKCNRCDAIAPLGTWLSRGRITG